jgi:hypothetical protein
VPKLVTSLAAFYGIQSFRFTIIKADYTLTLPEIIESNPYCHTICGANFHIAFLSTVLSFMLSVPIQAFGLKFGHVYAHLWHV